MKHLIVLVALVLPFVAACSAKHDKTLDENLVGTWTWQYSLFGEGEPGVSPDFFESPDIIGCGQSLEFRNNGTFYWTYTGCESEGDELSNWYVEDGRLVIDDHGEKTYADYFFGNDTLNITTEDEGSWEIEKWTR